MLQKLLNKASLVLTGLMFVLGIAHADTFRVMPHPQPVADKSKIEVIEFFWYGCPHCYHLEPALNNWLKTLPKDVNFRRIPAVWNDGMARHAQIYAALDTMKVLPKLHSAIFDAIHKDSLELRDEAVLRAFLTKNKVNVARFMQIYNGFGVKMYPQQALNMTRDYEIQGVPTFIVNGKYVTGAAEAGGEPQLFETLNKLIAQERK